jgi:hypothetical protein
MMSEFDHRFSREEDGVAGIENQQTIPIS